MRRTWTLDEVLQQRWVQGDEASDRLQCFLSGAHILIGQPQALHLQAREALQLEGACIVKVTLLQTPVE